MEDGLEGVSSLLLCAGESLQTMVFPQPVDKGKDKRKEEQFIKISLIKYFSIEIYKKKRKEKFQWMRRI